MEVVKPGSPKKVMVLDGGRNVSAGSRGSRGSAKRTASPKRVPSAVQRWKKQHEQSMMEKLVGLRNEKKELTKLSKEQACSIARKIPTEILARDWLNAIEATLETRAYLVEKVLPTLILGVEKLLNEADKRGLAKGSDERDPNFNPINFLAQYLMRNNPKYSNFSEASPYVRGLREVMEDLKRELFNIEDNRLARIKAEAKRRREEREKIENLKQQELERRTKVLIDQFTEWNATPEGRVELQLLQNALRSFVELSEKFPVDLREAAKLSHPLEATDVTGKSLTVKEFAKYIIRYTEELPRQLFNRFMLHMAKCARANRSLSQREGRRIRLTNLFISCDHSGIGLLDRHRILSLFENYWDIAKDTIKSNLRNPRKWPVVEVDEADDSLSDEEEVTENKPPSVQQEQIQEQKDVVLTGELLGKEPQTPATVGQPSVSFAEGTSFERDRTAMTTLSRSHSQLSMFDESSLNVSQFVQLTETFLGDEPTGENFDDLMKFIKEEYQETEEEKMERLVRARKEAMSSRRKMLMDQLFEKWDNDGSGYLDQDEVENVMMKYKDGQESEAIENAKTELKKKSKHPQDSRLSKREFRQFVTLVADAMPGADSFEYFIEFLNNSVERTYAERIRGEARKKWLQQIITAAETGGASIEPVYKAIFQALYKDAEAHGGGKNIAASISLLERNTTAPERGDVCLRYVAATTEDADFMLGKILYKDMKGISFPAIESGKPIHVPRVANHGNIQFWNPYRHPEEREGSFIVIPLKDRRKRVFGLLGVDTLNDSHTKSIFITHEIQFYQGVSKSFSIAYHNIDMKKKLLRITESAVSWIHRRSPHVKEIICYMVEPDEQAKDFVLRKMMTTDKKGNIQNIQNPPRLERKDNLFRDYLFKSVDNSESVSADAYGERHLAFPLRDDQGRAVAIVDLSLGELKQLPSHENREVQRMLRLLQIAHKEITKEMAGEDKTVVLEAEHDEETRMDIMFDRLMLMELRENVAKIDSKAFAELRSYNDPPRIVHDILKAVCAIFYPEETEQGAFDDWTQMKGQITLDLLQTIATYDPTAGQDLIPPEKIERYLQDVPHGEVAKHSSVPAQHMYNWVFVCLSLIEHTLKMRENNNDNLLPARDQQEQSEEGQGREESA